jgi:hypothetical protein
MSYQETLVSVTLDADASVGVYTGVPGLPGGPTNNAGLQYRFVKVTGEHQCGLATAATDVVVGVLQNKPQGVGHAATVALGGITHVEASAAIAAGDQVTATADGRAVTSTTNVKGIALHSATAAGQLVPVLLRLGN